MRIPTKNQLIYWSTIFYDIYLGRKSFFVVGYPKTGTNWVCNLLSTYFDTPVLESWNERMPILNKRIFHLHRLFKINKVKARTIYVLRDGRDALVSRYFMITRINRKSHSQIQDRFKLFSGNEMREDNIKENLTHFIHFIFDIEKSTSKNYYEHVNYAINNDLFIIKYEDLLRDKEKTLSECILYLSPSKELNLEKMRGAINKYDFNKLKKQKNQHDSTFLRKGISGDWKNYFDLEAAKLFDDYAGETLIKMGYEKDNLWINI